MPCTPDAVCDRTDTNTFSTANLQAPDIGGTFANMGWVGFVKLTIKELGSHILRVTSADVALSQEITKPDVIDGRLDKTVYQLGPKTVEGTLSFPLIADVLPDAFAGCPNVTDVQTGIAGTLLDNIWCWATARNPQGRMLYHDSEIEIRYANHAAFKFDSATVNTFALNITHGETVNVDIGVIGRGRTPSDGDPSKVGSKPTIEDFLAPARVLTWNDATVNGIGGCSNPEDLFFSNQVREFTLEINNNADRFYTLNASLFPADVNVGQREITGSITLLGLQDRLRLLAETNADRFTEKNEIRFAFYPGDEQSGARDWRGIGSTDVQVPPGAIFGKRLTGVVFEIEEMAMTTEVFETTVNYHALANDQENYQSISPGECSFPAWQ